MQVHNSDGVWLRLSEDSLKDWCAANQSLQSAVSEGWVLRYNRHTGRTLIDTETGSTAHDDAAAAVAGNIVEGNRDSRHSHSNSASLKRARKKAQQPGLSLFSLFSL